MGNIRKRGKIWYVDYRVNGRRQRKRIGQSKELAALALKDIEVKIARSELGFLPKDNDLDKLLDEFKTYSVTHHAPASQKRYKAMQDHFRAFLKLHPHISKISQLGPKFFEDYQTQRKKQEAANKTVNNELIFLRALFNLAVKWGYARENPTKGVTAMKEDRNKKPRFLTKDECKVLLAKADPWFRSILYTFLQTGMRKAELENLTWSDVDFNRRKIKIRYKEEWSPKTSEREIPIREGLLFLLREKKETDGNRSLFVFHREGEKIEPNYLRKQLIPLTKRCGFPEVTKLHSLRHTFASHLVMNGADLPTIKKLLGHSEIETTMIYSHLADEHVDRAIEKLNI